MKLLLFLALGVGLLAQDISTPRYTAYKKTSLAGAAEVLTVMKPVGNNKSAFLESAYIYCSVACTVSIEMFGTYSSGTPVIPGKSMSTWPASTITATSGTSISGTTVLISYDLPAGGDKSLDLTGAFLTNDGDCFTLRTTSITGTVILATKYAQK